MLKRNMELLCEKELAIGLLLIGLLHGVSGIAAECDVYVPCACCLDGLCHDGTSACVSEFCKDGYWGAQCTNYCPQECVTCHRNFEIERLCFECVPGYFGQDCSSNCSSGCKVCNKDTGRCEECSAGYYGTNCDERCSLGCKNSTCHIDTGKCIKCEVGYFGEETCNMRCEQNCQNNTCRIQTGICSACEQGFYGNYCNKSCSKNCKDEICIQSTGYCVSCELGYFGLFCNEVCPANCMWNLCFKEIGHCFSCKNGYYGSHCSKQCPSMCNNRTCSQGEGVCTSGCSQGFKGDKCDECIDGKYGDLCAQNCSVNCLNSDCYGINGSCKFGCEPEYSDMTFCCANNRNCEKCSSYTECTSCINRTYGTFCELKCSDNCVIGCDKSTGHCLQCYINYYGPNCQHICSEQCASHNETSQLCDQNGSCLLDCEVGYYGNKCDIECSVACRGMCERQSGVCDSCTGNTHGEFCQQDCPTSCLQNENTVAFCYRVNGTCMFGCQPNFFGSTCESICSKSCNDSCDGHSGQCFGCLMNKYGSHCEHTCSDGCVQGNNGTQICGQTNGACRLGCMKGFSGDTCSRDSDGVKTKTVAIAAGVAAVLVSIVILAIIMLVVRKRNISKGNMGSDSFKDGMSDIYHIDIASNADANVTTQTTELNGRCVVEEEFENVDSKMMSTQLDKENTRCISANTEDEEAEKEEPVALSIPLEAGFKSADVTEEQLKDGESAPTDVETGFNGAGVKEEELKKRESAAKSTQLDEGGRLNGAGVKEEEFKEGQSAAKSTQLNEGGRFKDAGVKEENSKEGELAAKSTQFDEGGRLYDAGVKEEDSKEGESTAKSTQLNEGGILNCAGVKEEYSKEGESAAKSTQLDEKGRLNGAGVKEEDSKEGESAAKSTQLDEGGRFKDAGVKEEDSKEGESTAKSTQLNEGGILNCAGVKEEDSKERESAAKSTQLDEGGILNCAGVKEEDSKEGESAAKSTQLDEGGIFKDAGVKEENSKEGESTAKSTQLDEGGRLNGAGVKEEDSKEGESAAKSTQLDEGGRLNDAGVKEEDSKEGESAAKSTQLDEGGRLNDAGVKEEDSKEGESTAKSTQLNEGGILNCAGVKEEDSKEGESAAKSSQLDEGVRFDSAYVHAEEELDEGEPIVSTTEPDEETNPYYSNARRLITRIPMTDLRQKLEKSDKVFMEEFRFLPNGLTKTTTEAQKSCNASKNRYKMVHPYDDSRVKLEDADSDYINACYIDGFRAKRAYIASQGPTIKQLGTDFKAFWQMVWQEKVETIVMVTKLHETSGMKCGKYWPDLGSSSNYAGFSVECVKEERFAQLTVRSLNISKNEEKRCINHVNFTAWPDKAVPDDVTSLIDLRYKVVNAKKMFDGPLLVHCSAGIGRTGTYIALDILTDQGSTKNYVDVFDCVFNMRNQRVHMVQTLEQYKFLHHAVLWTLTSDIKPLPADRFMNLSWLSDHKLNEMMEVGHKHTVTLLVNERSTAAQYINAVFLDSYEKQNQFIVAMTPLPETVAQFLSMIIQNDLTCIVDLTPQDYKHNDIGEYLPADTLDYVEWEQHVFTISHREDRGCFIKTEITISETTKPADQGRRTIHHYSFTKWNASATLPDSADDFVKLVNEIGATATDTKATRPIAVHCPSGAERSGLFCAVWLLIERMKIDREVSVLNTLRQVKTRRRMAISSSEQIRFCFKCVASYMNNMHDPVYSNIKTRL